MIKYNLIRAIRSILKRKFLSLIIIISLTLGLICSFYIAGFIYNELTVDKFNKNCNRIYGLLSNHPQSPEKKISMIIDGVPQFIKKTYPEVSDYCQVWNQSVDGIKIGQNSFFSKFRIIEASPSFFSFFSFPLISGNKKNVLSSNQMVVVSKEFAQKYFGSIDVSGKSIEMNKYGMTSNIFFISGVFDNTCVHSHLTFDMVLSNEGRDIRGSHAYLLLDESANPEELEKKFIKDKKNIPAFFSDIPMNYYLQNLKSIYFQPYWESKIAKSRSIQYIYITAIIGILLLLVACFNYINLIYYQLINRTKEIVVHKINGARFMQSSRLLLTECALLIGISILFAVILLKQSILFLNRLTEANYSLADFFQPVIFLICTLVIGSIGLFSWMLIYSFIRKQKSSDFINSSRTPKVKKQTLPLLIGFQFVASVILIASTLTIVKQVRYIHNKDIGLDKSVIEISLGIENANKAHVFRDELRKHPAIANVSMSEGSPMHGGGKVIIHYIENGIKKMYAPSVYSGDSEYLNVCGLKLLDGVQFSLPPNNNINKCYINKTLADYLGIKNPVGKFMPGTENKIIGVTDNFLWRSLENPVEPAYITFCEQGENLLVKLNPKLKKEGIDHIKHCWATLVPDYPIDFSTIGELFNKEHRKQENLVKLITTFCMLSIFISLIGLLALSLFSIQQRIKEIGIHKVNGAKVVEIAILLNINIIKWIFLAIVIATPIAWYAMYKWLQNFAYKTELSWWVFAAAGSAAVAVALLTVSWQSWRAATRNPIEALRYE